MKRLSLLASLCLMAFAPGAQAKSGWPNAGLSSVTSAVSSAFYRRAASIDGVTGQPPAVAGPLFPDWGFAPRDYPRVSWALKTLNAHSTSLCFSITVNSEDEWQDTLFAFGLHKLQGADGNCADSEYPGLPREFPSVLNAKKTLDGYRTMPPTILPAGLDFTGVQAGSVTTAGVTLHRAVGVSSTTTIGISANASAGEDGILSVETRDGFSVTHNCGSIPAGGNCSLQLTAASTLKNPYLGFLRIRFSSGKWAVIGLRTEP